MNLGDWAINKHGELGQVLHFSGSRPFLILPDPYGCTQSVHMPNEMQVVSPEKAAAQLAKVWRSAHPAFIEDEPPYGLMHFVRPAIGNYFVAWVTAISESRPRWVTLQVAWALHKLYEGAAFSTCLRMIPAGNNLPPKLLPPPDVKVPAKLHKPQMRALTF